MKPSAGLGFSENLFWDVNPETLNLKRRTKYIVRRVLEAGTLDLLKRVQLNAVFAKATAPPGESVVDSVYCQCLTPMPQAAPADLR